MVDRMSGNDRMWLVAAVVCLLIAASAGCAEDTPSEWGGFDDDGTNDDDTIGPQDPHFFVPETLPDDSTCRNDWCWLHPRPFGHNVKELREVNDKIYGVANLESRRWPEPFVWDTDLRLLDPPIPSGALVYPDGMTVSSDGWLAVTESGTVYDFGPDGTRGTYELPDGEYTHIEGESLTRFLATRAQRGGGVLRTPQGLTRVDDPAGGLAGASMWPNGEIWQISMAEGEPRTSDDLRMFPTPKPPEGTDRGRSILYPTLGPSPTSLCGSDGFWGSTGGPFVYRWDAANETWSPSRKEVEGVTDFACYDEGYLFAVTMNGEGYTRSEGKWKFSFGDTDQFLTDVESHGSSLFIGGHWGALYRISSGEFHRKTSGFHPPFTWEGGPFRSSLRALWVSEDESEGIVAEGGRTYLLTDDGSEELKFDQKQIYSTGFVVLDPEMFGAGDTRFALLDVGLFRWTGSVWTESSVRSKFPSEATVVGLDGQSEDGVWLALQNQLYRYDGESWAHLSAPGSDIRRTMQADGLTFSSLMVDVSGEVMLSAGSDVYRVSRQNGPWQLRREMTTPCGTVTEMHASPDGTFWVAGDDVCVASRTEDGWTTYEHNLTVDGPEPSGPFGQDYPDQWEFTARPNSQTPLLFGGLGILEPASDGSLERIYDAGINDAAYLPERNVVLALTPQGLVTKYY